MPSSHPGDSRLEARIASYELAAKMQLAAPEALDLSRETEAVRKLYGLDDTDDRDLRPAMPDRPAADRARRALRAGLERRRRARPTTGTTTPTSRTNCRRSPASTDRPIAALLADLKQRGLLDDTLVVWSTEFGRHPFSQGADGRDHNGGTFVPWLAGAGVKGGVAHGESDEWSWRGNKSNDVHDLHATILHLLGIDHEQLTFRHNGSNRRLTDVHGHVIQAHISPDFTPLRKFAKVQSFIDREPGQSQPGPNSLHEEPR